ncbi:hypothetical protein C8R44DRAFT_17033 [Mycena epipterygia]|nr:hypothetical protein C8R44DRAFT_17033 [Mycena epipterygia]
MFICFEQYYQLIVAFLVKNRELDGGDSSYLQPGPTVHPRSLSFISFQSVLGTLIPNAVPKYWGPPFPFSSLAVDRGVACIVSSSPVCMSVRVRIVRR